ncbi:helix-turn-helix transcriptional regulator [Kibdelosporangium philippinense]|uniref:Helix-turn-helix transcriptional regulator n=1 Tax=Kibdelosporangium philippinense TaxID=211113 RepID=A0ABS8Z8B1_9PSEU|nr:helix-turn-helix domain-containing protein [Kibdelosporangium philippinense]MCE7004129.1 helix-turn-helix transcriptional regulator [Kibdelosporangium philippinense]
MLGKMYDNQVCSIARTLEVVGERWSLLIVRDALQGKRRFDEFQQSLGVARNILSDRLNKLVADGILDRVEYQQHPARYEYVLTERGRDLRPVLITMLNWGDHHAPDPDGPPRVVEHATCGNPTTYEPVCQNCGIIHRDEVRVLPRS